MLKDDSELEYPQCEIRARQHWYPIPNYFCLINYCLSLYCKGCDIVVILVWVCALCVVPANRKRWRPSCHVTSVSYPGRVRPMRLLPQWQPWAALCPHSKAYHHSSQAWGIPCMVSKCSSLTKSCVSNHILECGTCWYSLVIVWCADFDMDRVVPVRTLPFCTYLALNCHFFPYYLFNGKLIAHRCSRQSECTLRM